MAGENLRAHDAWLPLQRPNEAAEVALSSQADMESVEDLKRPVRLLLADAQPDPRQCNIITRFLHTSRDRGLTTARQLLYPDTLESVHVCGRWKGGEVASLPRVESTLLWVAHAGWEWGRGNPISCFPARELPSRDTPRACAMA